MWSYSLDVSAVALRALERGRPGERYLAVGRPQDAMSLADLCNRAADMGGIAARVENDTSDVPGRYGSISGPTLSIAQPASDSTRTINELGVTPTAVDDALATMVRWLRTAGRIPEAAARSWLGSPRTRSARMRALRATHIIRILNFS